MKELILKNEIGQLEWDSVARTVIKTFAGMPKGKPMEDIFNGGVRLLLQHRGSRWVSDNSLLKPYPPESIDWINNNWFPRVKAAGWKYWAIVEPVSVVGAMSMRNFKDHYAQQGIELHVVRSVEEGLDWIAKRPG